MTTWTGKVQRQNTSTLRVIIPASNDIRVIFGLTQMNWQTNRTRLVHLNTAARDAMVSGGNGVTAFEINGSRFPIAGMTPQSSKNGQFGKNHPISQHLLSLNLEDGDDFTLTLIH